MVTDRTLNIWGRKLRIPESAGTTARFSFQELCGKPLSAADYIEVTRTFETIFVTDIPSMTLSQKDMARRFITFIDGAFWAHCGAGCSRSELTLGDCSMLRKQDQVVYIVRGTHYRNILWRRSGRYGDIRPSTWSHG